MAVRLPRDYHNHQHCKPLLWTVSAPEWPTSTSKARQCIRWQTKHCPQHFPRWWWQSRKAPRPLNAVRMYLIYSFTPDHLKITAGDCSRDKLRFLFICFYLGYSSLKVYTVWEGKKKGKKEFSILNHFIRISFLSSTKLCSFSSSIHRMSPLICKIYCVRKSWVECSSRTGPLLQKDLK